MLSYNAYIGQGQHYLFTFYVVLCSPTMFELQLNVTKALVQVRMKHQTSYCSSGSKITI